MKNKALLGITQLFAVAILYVVAHGADQVSRLPKALRGAIGSRAHVDKAKAERVVSMLDGLEKTLILESTRAEKDVDIYSKYAPGVVYIQTQNGFGSGAIIQTKGGIRVITNAHVIGTNKQVSIAFKPKDGSELAKNHLIFTATVEKLDEVTDLALLTINSVPKSVTLLNLGDGSKIAVGQDVSAIGHPADLVWTYTKGIISQIRNNYDWTYDDGKKRRANVIQTQTPINPGNSGGPLFDDAGRVIGINSFGKPGAEGLNYAIAVDEIQKFLARPKPIRTAPTQQPANDAKGNCPEEYDTKGRRWADIVGCYSNRTSPPPEFWVIFGAPKSLSYMARSAITAGKIDTIITNVDPSWQKLVYAIDANCDGVVDIIGEGNSSRNVPDSFRRPSENVRLVSLAVELDTALKAGKIPYKQLQVCQ